MHFFSVLSLAALSISVSAQDVTTTVTTTATVTATPTRHRKADVTNVAAPCLAAAGYAPGEFRVATRKDGRTTFFDRFCNGAYGAMQDDGNFVIYPGSDGSAGNGWSPLVNQFFYCQNSRSCLAEFTSDGNFHIMNYGEETFSTNTGGLNAQRLIFSSGQPYVVILDNNGNELYSTGTNAEAERKMSVLVAQHKQHAKNSTHTS